MVSPGCSSGRATPPTWPSGFGWASSHPAEMAEMGRRARAEYELRYTATTNYAELADVYRQALAHRRSARVAAHG